MFGLFGPANAAWFLQMLTFAEMAPAAVLTLETDGLGEEDKGVSPWKVEPTISTMVPGASVLFLITCTLLSWAFRVLAAGRSEAAAYSISELVKPKLGASPVPTTSKPRLVRSPAAWPAMPPTPDPFSTSTLTLEGAMSTTGVAALAFGFLPADGIVSCAIALKSSSACGCWNSTLLMFGGQGTLGEVTNFTDLGVSPRRLSAICSIADWSRPVSVVIAFAVSRTTFSSLLGLPSRPLCSMRWTREAMRN